MRERGLKNTSVSALLGFQESIPVVTGESSRGQKDVLEFFARNPELLEHDFWELFLGGRACSDETTGTAEATLWPWYRLLTSHYAGFRDRVLDECLAAMRRDFRETRIFWVLYRGLEPTTAETCGACHSYWPYWRHRSRLLSVLLWIRWREQCQQ